MKRLDNHIACCLAGDLEPMRQSLKRQKGPLKQPLDWWVPLLLSLGGSSAEAHSYQDDQPEAMIFLKQLIQRTIRDFSIKLLDHHPEIGKSCLEDSLSEKLARKLRRKAKDLPSKEQQVWFISMLLTDAEVLRGWQEAGYLKWDNGDYQVAWAIACAWSPVLGKSMKPLRTEQPKVQMLAYGLLLRVAKEHPEHHLVEWVKDRYTMGWVNLNDGQLDILRERLVGSQKKVGDNLANASLIGLGIKYKKPALVKEHTVMLKEGLGKTATNAISAAEVWGEVLSGKTETDSKSLTSLAKDATYSAHLGYIKTIIDKPNKTQ